MIGPEALVLLTVAGALFAIGLMCLIARSNLVKMVIGLEILGKGVSLVFVTAGYLNGDVAMSQAVVFTLIIIEAVVAGVALLLAFGRRGLVGRSLEAFGLSVAFTTVATATIDETEDATRSPHR